MAARKRWGACCRKREVLWGDQTGTASRPCKSYLYVRKWLGCQRPEQSRTACSRIFPVRKQERLRKCWCIHRGKGPVDYIIEKEKIKVSSCLIGMKYPRRFSGKEPSCQKQGAWVQSPCREDPHMGEGNGNSLQYSCLGNSMDRAWPEYNYYESCKESKHNLSIKQQ